MGVIFSVFYQCTSKFSPLEHDEEQALLEKSPQVYDPNAALARELRGQRMHVDMTKSFSDWPSGARHTEYHRLLREADRVLEL